MASLDILVLEGMIVDALKAIYDGLSVAHLRKRPALACSGGNGSCGA
jgi:hypothetical protein